MYLTYHEYWISNISTIIQELSSKIDIAMPNSRIGTRVYHCLCLCIHIFPHAFHVSLNLKGACITLCIFVFIDIYIYICIYICDVYLD